MSVVFFTRMVGMVVLAIVGYENGYSISGPQPAYPANVWIISMILAGGALGLLLGPYCTIQPYKWIRNQIKQLPANVLFPGAVGLLIGLVVAALLAFPLSMLPGELGHWLPLAAALFMSYIGISIMVMRQRDMVQAMTSFMGIPPSHRAGSGGELLHSNQLILDTSAIIDGRIADISQTGFFQGSLLIPTFMLDELRHIADSPDAQRRNRGRRGLEMLNRLQKEAYIPIQISDMDFEDAIEVDAKLIKLARALRAPIITNDFNLNRVAELQGVRALNINELANAVKSVVLPGEEIQVRVIQEGKEAGQGVAFLDYGAMVVVEAGKRYLGQQVPVVITRVLQTVAGRMIFALQRSEQPPAV